MADVPVAETETYARVCVCVCMSGHRLGWFGQFPVMVCCFSEKDIFHAGLLVYFTSQHFFFLSIYQLQQYTGLAYQIAL